MTGGRFLDRLLTLRRLIRGIETIAAQQTEQTVLLRRLADHFAPLPIETSPEEVARTSAISYTRDEQQAMIQDFTDAFYRDLSRLPTEDEIAEFLDAHAAMPGPRA